MHEFFPYPLSKPDQAVILAHNVEARTQINK